jgi:hypothetical protein
VGGGPAYPSSPRAGGRLGGGSNPAVLLEPAQGAGVRRLCPGTATMSEGPAGTGSRGRRSTPSPALPLPGGGCRRSGLVPHILPPPGPGGGQEGGRTWRPCENRLRGRAFDPLPGPPPARGRVQEVGGGPAYPSSPRAGGRLGGGSNPAVLLEPAQGAGVRPPPQPSPCPGEGVGGGGRSRVPFLPPGRGEVRRGVEPDGPAGAGSGGGRSTPSPALPLPGGGCVGVPSRVRRWSRRTGRGSRSGSGRCAGARR